MRAALSTTDASSHTLIPAAGAGAVSGEGNFAEIEDLIITNESATATVVTLTNGAESYKFAIGANGGIVINWSTRFGHAVPNTAWTVQSSQSVNLDYVVKYKIAA